MTLTTDQAVNPESDEMKMTNPNPEELQTPNEKGDSLLEETVDTEPLTNGIEVKSDTSKSDNDNLGESDNIEYKTCHSETSLKNAEEDQWVDLLGSGSLKKKILRDGQPDTRPQRLQKCLLNYTCFLQDGTIVESEVGFEMTLGDCEVIQGLDVAIGLMNVGEKCTLIVEPRLGYGNVGLLPKIPKSAILTYDIELLHVEEEDDIETLTVSQRKQIGNRKRERGNWWYCRNENTIAVQCYRRALDYLDEVEGGGISDPSGGSLEEVTDAALQELLEDRISVCNNMAAAQIKLELYDAALKSLQTVLQCQPNNVKALYRQSKIYKAQNDFPAALKCLQKANQTESNNMEIEKEIANVQAVMQKQKATEKELARRMFNGPKTQPKDNKEKKSGRSGFVTLATLGVSLAMVMVGIAAYKLKFPGV